MGSFSISAVLNCAEIKKKTVSYHRIKQVTIFLIFKFIIYKHEAVSPTEQHPAAKFGQIAITGR